MPLYRHLILLLFVCYNTFSYATPQLILQDDINSYTDFNISYFEESADVPLSIESIAKLDMNLTATNAFTFGYKEKPLWIKFDIVNNTSEVKNMILELTEMFHKTVDLYVVTPSSISHQKNGIDVPFNERTIENINPSFLLSFKANETKQMYIKLESFYPIFAAIHIKTPKQYKKDTQIRNYILLFYFGAITIIAFYNLFIFFYLRDKIYFYYVSYVLLFTIWVTLYKGFISYFVDAELFNIIQVTLPGFLIMLIRFTQSLLDTKNSIPGIHKLLNGFNYVLLISLIWLLLSFQDGFHFINIIVTPVLILLLYSAVIIAIKGSKVAKLYFVVLFIYFIGISLVSMLALTLLPYHTLIVNLPLIGSFIEIVLFSLLLAYRINILREETLSYQNKLLKQEETESIRLSKMVTEKTSKLEEVNTKLENELQEKSKLEKILKYQASTDSLTNILNRRSFFEACDNEIKLSKRYEHPLSFIIIDIDYFKKINDTYGHLNGDIVLIDLVNVITNTIRTTDLFGRIGGEEFAVLMPETKQKDAMNLADRIRKNISENVSVLEGTTVNITVSIGLSFLTTEDSIIQTVLRRADLALFKAKESGRNQLCCLGKS